MTDLTALMSACDAADAELNTALSEEAAATRKRELKEAEALALHRALMLVGSEQKAKAEPPKPKRAYTRRNKGATVPSASELPAQHRHDGRVEPSNTGAGAPLAAHQTDGPFPILPRARA